MNQHNELPMTQRRRIELNSGLVLSIQANDMAYCSPQNDLGPWTEVEVGYPSEMVPELMKYAEEPDNPTETVYGWVPMKVIVSIIDKHGGVKGAVNLKGDSVPMERMEFCWYSHKRKGPVLMESGLY